MLDLSPTSVRPSSHEELSGPTGLLTPDLEHARWWVFRTGRLFGTLLWKHWEPCTWIPRRSLGPRLMSEDTLVINELTGKNMKLKHLNKLLDSVLINSSSWTSWTSLTSFTKRIRADHQESFLHEEVSWSSQTEGQKPSSLTIIHTVCVLLHLSTRQCFIVGWSLPHGFMTFKRRWNQFQLVAQLSLERYITTVITS